MFSENLANKVRPFRARKNTKASLHLCAALTLTVLPAILFFSAIASVPSSSFMFFASLGGAAILSGFGIAKIFGIQHDLGHNSFFSNKKVNFYCGLLLSTITLVPFCPWMKDHQKHHAVFGDLERQTKGDVLLWSVSEYKSARIQKRFLYRIFRSEFFMLGIAPLLYVLIRQRYPSENKLSDIVFCIFHTTASSLMLYTFFFYTNFPLGAVYAFVSYYIFSFTAMIFFISEHQFKSAQWKRSADWSFIKATLTASSWLHLPSPLRWLTGNIGLHQLHHFDPGVPSYRLHECLLAVPEFQIAEKLSFWEAVKCSRLALWSDDKSSLVTFAEAARLQS